jgi:hypothetical protein
MPGPLKALLAPRPISDRIEGLDPCHLREAGPSIPLADVRSRVHYYDKLAETIEWLYCLHEAPAPSGTSRCQTA